MPARARTTLLHLFQALMASWLLAAAVPYWLALTAMTRTAACMPRRSMS